MSENTIYKLNNVGLYYRQSAALPWRRNRFWALQDVSFNVHASETVGVIGRNGSGKSSLLKILSGIMEPDAGSIHRANVSSTVLAFGKGAAPRLTGRQNIVLSGLQLGMSKAHVTSKIPEIIELADIGKFIDEPMRTYSAGMRSRLGFSIAYHVKTDVLLIDEALAPGDERFRQKATGLIKERINSA